MRLTEKTLTLLVLIVCSTALCATNHAIGAAVAAVAAVPIFFLCK